MEAYSQLSVVRVDLEGSVEPQAFLQDFNRVRVGKTTWPTSGE
jgi:hypothetical protein